MGKTLQREVEFAVGFVGGQWSEVSVSVEENYERVLDDPEIIEKALEVLKKMDFSPNAVAFHHVLYIEDPEGGFGEDNQY